MFQELVWSHLESAQESRGVMITLIRKINTNIHDICSNLPLVLAFSWADVPSDIIEREEFITYTAARHQGVMTFFCFFYITFL